MLLCEFDEIPPTYQYVFLLCGRFILMSCRRNLMNCNLYKNTEDKAVVRYYFGLFGLEMHKPK